MFVDRRRILDQHHRRALSLVGSRLLSYLLAGNELCECSSLSKWGIAHETRGHGGENSFMSHNFCFSVRPVLEGNTRVFPSSD